MLVEAAQVPGGFEVKPNLEHFRIGPDFVELWLASGCKCWVLDVLQLEAPHEHTMPN
jgi:hypothetical protein